MQKLVSGFTLIELMVVLAIITIITGIAFANQSSFNRTLVLANTAYDIGLTFRSAETYGTASRATGGDVRAGYGLHFSQQSPNTSFVLFADSFPSPQSGNCHGLPKDGASAPNAKQGNCVYDAGQDVNVNTYTLNNGISIADFCARTGGIWYCANSHGSTLTSLDVVFARPNPDPFISTNQSYNAANTEVCLTLTSSAGGERYISVAQSGQINPRALSCPTP